MSHGEPIWSGYCMFAVAIDLIVHHIQDILRLKKAENSSGQHPFVYQRRRTSASSDTLSRWLKHDKLALSSTAFFSTPRPYVWLNSTFPRLFNINGEDVRSLWITCARLFFLFSFYTFVSTATQTVCVKLSIMQSQYILYKNKVNLKRERILFSYIYYIYITDLLYWGIIPYLVMAEGDAFIRVISNKVFLCIN